jgi:Ran GTPase-activating protein (RanGAP) involved in mRNA processing and transport
MQYLSQGLQHAKSLSKLTLDNCNIKPPAETFEIFSEGIYNSRSLQTLSLRNNRFSPPQGTWIANLIALNEDNPGTGIKELDLSENDLGVMIAPLAFVLRNNTTLLHLDLSNCKISHEGLSFLSNSLAENSCLETLDLSKNPLGGGGDTDESVTNLSIYLKNKAS